MGHSSLAGTGTTACGGANSLPTNIDFPAPGPPGTAMPDDDSRYLAGTKLETELVSGTLMQGY
jgi:hypothetical protein